jgi:hypothetical protein
MNQIHNITQLLVSSLILSGISKIPTSHGLLDRALKAAYDEGAFPDWVRREMHFVDSRIGLQCIELQEILTWAQNAELTTAPNPSYRYADVQISSRAANQLLRRIGVSEDHARQWGAVLQNHLNALLAADLNSEAADSSE